ncbi:hypothetical protein DIPPA_22644b, partial [Diplonema papillatum]
GVSRYDDLQLVPIVSQMCEALDYLHSKRVFHRDLKPANIFFTDNGQVKIGDFGLAKSFGKVQRATVSALVGSLRQTQAIGTPYYMSPEVCAGRVAQNGKVDMWGVGVTLLEVCGVPLQHPGRPEAGFLGIVVAIDEEKEHARLRLGLEIKGYSDSISDLLIRLVAFDPTRRPSAAEVLDMLQDVKCDSTIQRERKIRRAAEEFIIAAEIGDIDVITNFLAAGQDPDIKCHKDGALTTALYVASKNNHCDIIEVLTYHGADPRIPTTFRINQEDTAIATAARMSFEKALHLLLKHSLVLRASLPESEGDVSAESASLLIASEEGHLEVVRLLLTYGADVKYRAHYGSTALMLASREHPEVVELLLEHGADVDAKNSEGNTALMIACSAGCEDSVRELVRHRASTTERNTEGSTAEGLAIESGHTEIANFLRHKRMPR